MARRPSSSNSSEESDHLSTAETPAVGPGHIKGVALLTAIRALRSYREEALQRLPKEVHRYLIDEVLTTAWYPEQHLFTLLAVIAELRAQPGLDIWEWMGQRTAEMDLSGVFASLIQPGRPLVTLSRLPRLWQLYRSSGELIVELVDEYRATVELVNYPPLDDQLSRLTSAYFCEALRLSGGEGPRVEVTRLGPGRALFALTWS